MVNGKKIAVLCMSQLHDIENNRFTYLLAEYLKKEGFCLWIYNMSISEYWKTDNVSAESAVFDLIDFSKADVIIFMYEKIQSAIITSRVIENAKAHGVPAVVVDGKYDGCVSVRYDYSSGFERLVRHVVNEHNARDLYFIGGDKGNPFSDEREEIFRKVLKENGIAIDESMFGYGKFWADPARQAAEELIRKRKKLPQAVICANDIMAVNVASVLKEHGINIPQDIIVTGFDGIDDIYFTYPTITSAKCSAETLADTVVRAVKDSFCGEQKNEYLVTPELLRNESCGCGSAFQPDFLNKFNDRFYRYQDDYNSLTKLCERIQAAETIKDAAWSLYDPIIHDVICVADKRCSQKECDLFEEGAGIANDMVVIFDCGHTENILTPIANDEIIPRLDEFAEDCCPLVFNCLTYLNIPFGYICFHFSKYDFTDYSKIPQTAATVGMGLGVFVTRQYQRYLQDRIEQMYRLDSLTGLLNRLSFYKEFDEIKDKLIAEKIPINIVFTDLDGLKRINDTYGHNAGDTAIAAAAKALKNSVPADSLCVRFGGDEMLAVVFGECDSNALGIAFANELEAFDRVSDQSFTVSASVGIYKTVLTEDIRIEDVIRIADKEMYQQKIQKKKQRRE